MKHPISWAFIAVALLMLVFVFGSSYLPRPFSALHRQSSLLSKAHASGVATTPNLTVVTPTPQAPASTTGSATPVAQAAPVVTPISGTSVATPVASPQASPVDAPAPVLTKESNGISIGCLPGPPNQYLSCLAEEPTGFSMTFYLYLPKGYNPKTKYPLVLLLHGGGEVSE
ncbi:MAG TPA: hypothetical protein VHV31_14965, partial [Nitrolancea sp.]|nr:hypothetical protein [Nitrolancea sp.]